MRSFGEQFAITSDCISAGKDMNCGNEAICKAISEDSVRNDVDSETSGEYESNRK
jgi:hypothetical protein